MNTIKFLELSKLIQFIVSTSRWIQRFKFFTFSFTCDSLFYVCGMPFSAANITNHKVEVESKTIERVKSLKYLAINITGSKDITLEVRE